MVLFYGTSVSKFDLNVKASASSSTYNAYVYLDNTNGSIKNISIVSKSNGTPQINGTTKTVGSVTNVSSSTTITLRVVVNTSGGGSAVFRLNP